MIRLTLYTRTDCHLCHEMRATIEEVARGVAVTMEEIDVDSAPELATTYGDEVPVLCIEGRKAFKYRVDAATLRARLARERR
jgi:glutaredoxin